MISVDIEQVKQYNKILETYKNKSAQLKAEIEVNSREINRLCGELSKELGIEVTPENIRSIYEEQVKSINNNLAVGMDILNRIREEERIAQEDAVAQTSAANTVQNGVAYQAPVQAPVQTPVQTPTPAAQPNQPPIPPMFGAGSAPFGAQSFNPSRMSEAAVQEQNENSKIFDDIGGIPPIFSGNI